LSCAQKIDAAIILNSTALPNKFVRYPFDRLVIDNYVFFKSIDELVNENKFKKCNIITGYNSDEFGYFLPYYFPLDKTPNNLNTFNAMIQLLQLSYNKQANPLLIENIKEKYFGTGNLESLDQNSIDYFRKFIQLQGDVLFVCPALDLAEVFSKSGVKAYAYEYKYRIPSSPFPIQLGNAVHTEEIYMVFGEPLSNKVKILKQITYCRLKFMIIFFSRYLLYLVDQTLIRHLHSTTLSKKSFLLKK
jgi:carboxylesterase type B